MKGNHPSYENSISICTKRVMIKNLFSVTGSGRVEVRLIVSFVRLRVFEGYEMQAGKLHSHSILSVFKTLESEQPDITGYLLHI